jgi:hypothetical protein
LLNSPFVIVNQDFAFIMQLSKLVENEPLFSI